ncbi:MAG: hypothetical protein K6T75_03875 [Acetobacteraceae bacterium]|nr:hypothetical protein [Acetobacteraceae bacterium]
MTGQDAAAGGAQPKADWFSGLDVRRFELLGGATPEEAREDLRRLAAERKLDPVRLNRVTQRLVALQGRYLAAVQESLRLAAAASGGHRWAARARALAERMVALLTELAEALRELLDCLEPWAILLADRWTSYKGRRMRRETREKWERLERELEERGYRAEITSTTTGRHSDPRHRQGRAVDFVVYKGRKGISPAESRKVEDICRQQGWTVYNEYLKDSTYKTGPHMHVSR